MVRPPWCDKLNGKRGPWTADEDSKMLAHVAKHGTGNWTAVPRKAAQQLPGRTDNDVKKCWNSRLRKKLSEMGIDPVTHKPLSKILADYGNIGGHVKSGSRIGSLSRDLKNVFTMKPEKYNSILPEGISNIDGHLMTTMLPPKMEPVQECFLNKFNNDSTDGNHSLDLLYQLQAIKMVTEASGTCAEYQTMLEPNHNVFDEGSSSSSTCSIEAQESLPTSSSWCDFLLEDQFLPSDPQAEQENAAELSSKDLTNQAQNVIVTNHCQNPGMMKPKYDQIIAEVNVGVDLTVQSNIGFGDQVAPSSSQHSSFVETIIDGENKIFLDFPNLLEELFNY
ncbi:F14D16.11-RELATED [Salix purpurea]|uniref:F14D16.11-RELATED n=2 Tax=Salix TaxID=40685 RepID=A0A9Q0W4W3_SALPP|nr:F14D16.11-RELATED [Salix purpurea]